MTPQHHIIKETSESLSRLFLDEFKRNGYKRVHIVEQAPKPEAIEGKLPAVSMYLYQMSIDPEGHDNTPHSELVEVPQEDGTIKEYFRRRRLWVRLDYLISAWAQTPEDEQLLIGLIIRTIMENPEIARDRLRGASFEDDFKLNVLMSARLDEGTLSRFWGSLNQPVRPAIQAWTAVPILPEKLEEFTRVQTRTLGYRNLTQESQDPDGKEFGPSGDPLADRSSGGGGGSSGGGGKSGGGSSRGGSKSSSDATSNRSSSGGAAGANTFGGPSGGDKTNSDASGRDASGSSSSSGGSDAPKPRPGGLRFSKNLQEKK